MLVETQQLNVPPVASCRSGLGDVSAQGRVTQISASVVPGVVYCVSKNLVGDRSLAADPLPLQRTARLNRRVQPPRLQSPGVQSFARGVLFFLNDLARLALHQVRSRQPPLGLCQSSIPDRTFLSRSFPDHYDSD